MVEIFDPLKAKQAVQDARKAIREDKRKPEGRRLIEQAAPVVPSLSPARRLKDSTAATDAAEVTKDPIREDFRVFLTLLWRHLLGSDPHDIQLDMAYFLQHGPERSVVMAFRGFAKSWITGGYALWRLYCNPQEKILVVSGNLTRSVATTNWCLMLIQTWDLLAFLRPKPNQRQSAKAFDVGPALPDQSPSFHAVGIGGQLVGFRGDCIIPDDVETQTNSITPDMRHKIKEAVKEFDSVLKPGGVIKFLGTPHDADSLYNELLKRGYTTRIWPAHHPTAEQIKGYGPRLAPFILHKLKKDPSLVGKSTMPGRFPEEDLAKRRLSLGNSEYALQFMLDTSLSDRNKYPLRLKDLMVMPLDGRVAPELVVWTNDSENRLPGLPHMGLEGDFLHKPVVPDGTPYSPFNRIIGFVDNSGRGEDETVLAIVGELNGTLYLLHMVASKAGYEVETLTAIAQACVRFRVQRLILEDNFSDGMFGALLRPILTAAWTNANAQAKREAKPEGGTDMEDVKVTNTAAKERRLLALLEPVTQQHRLVIGQDVIMWDYKSVQEMDGEDGRTRYALGYQYTHLTRERDCLGHDDRLDALAGAVWGFADIMGVDPTLMARRAAEERMDEELEKLYGLLEDDEDGLPQPARAPSRASGLGISKR